MGCIGVWTLYQLTQMGERAISFDVSDNRRRLDLLLSPEEQESITFVQGDLTNFDSVLATFKQYGITHIIHLGALQVPFCRANPVLGSQVNVVGTVNIFEAARQMGIHHLAYASSVAVYGPPEEYPPGLVAHDARHDPHNLYGVYKQANEGTAKIYWLENQIGSTALRPYTVYGVARDQGMTSEPTKAMLAAAGGKSYHINFSGMMQFQLASDVALQFIDAATNPLNGAYGFNLGGEPTEVSTVAEWIQAVKPDVEITVEDSPLALPIGFDDAELRKHAMKVWETPVKDGIRTTIKQFEVCIADGRLTV
jgi:nucleoside-diphosphate-sugar epimerase